MNIETKINTKNNVKDPSVTQIKSNNSSATNVDNSFKNAFNQISSTNPFAPSNNAKLINQGDENIVDLIKPEMATNVENKQNTQTLLSTNRRSIEESFSKNLSQNEKTTFNEKEQNKTQKTSEFVSTTIKSQDLSEKIAPLVQNSLTDTVKKEFGEDKIQNKNLKSNNKDENPLVSNMLKAMSNETTQSALNTETTNSQSGQTNTNTAITKNDIEKIYEQVSTMLEQVGLTESGSTKKSNKNANDVLSFIDTNLATTKADKKAKGKETGKASNIEKTKETETQIKVTEDDAKFFLKLTKTNEATLQGLQSDSQNLIDMADKKTQQSAKVSKQLLDSLMDAQKNNKTVRVDFDKDVSVIIKVSKDGQISADFLPGDKAVEQALKAMLPSLRQRFDEEGLNYKDLSYKQAKDDNQSKRENKEKKDE